MSEIPAPEIGSELFRSTTTIDRARLVRYAGASGDFNPIHWNERFATDVGLPGVIAHGMLTMGCAAAALEEWVEDPSRVLAFGTRFARPVVIPDPGEATLEIVGTLGAVDAGTWRVDLKVTCEGTGVLARTRATVKAPQ